MRSAGGELLWDDNAAKVMRGGEGGYNVLWSNIQTMKPALFSRAPRILAQRRHKDRDPAGRLASEVIERACNLLVEDSGFLQTFNKTVNDTLLNGRGTPWVRMVTKPRPPLPLEPVEGQPGLLMDESGGQHQAGGPGVVQRKDGAFELEQPGEDREIFVDYVHWSDFAHSPTPDRTWADVMRRGWVARRQAMTKDEGVERFGEKFLQAKLDYTGNMEDDDTSRIVAEDGDRRYAAVWEVFDAETKLRYFVTDGVKGPLIEPDDPYGLEGFFPCPEPSYGTMSNEDLIPTPDFLQYAALADELDVVSERIRRVTKAVKLCGIYDQSSEGIGDIVKLEDGQLRGVAGVTSGAGGASGLKDAVQWLPMREGAEALQILYAARDQAKQALYEVSGISDVIRGSVNQYEKAAQSKIKAQYAGQRLEQRRRSVERCARDVSRIMVELMIEHFEPDQLREQSGFDLMNEVENARSDAEEAVQQHQQAVQQFQEAMMQAQQGPPAAGPPPGAAPSPDAAQGAPAEPPQMPPDPGPPPPPPEQVVEQMWQQAVAILNNERTRGFRIDVETDSTVELDAGAQMEQRNEFMTALGGFLGNVLPAAPPEMMPALAETMMFVIRGFPAGRTLEAGFEQSIDMMKQAQQAAAENPPPPDPEAEAKAEEIRQKMEIEGRKAQADMAIKQQDAQAKQVVAETDAEVARIEAEAKIRELESKDKLNQAELQAKEMELEFLRKKYELEQDKKEEDVKAAAARARLAAKPPPKAAGGKK